MHEQAFSGGDERAVVARIELRRFVEGAHRVVGAAEVRVYRAEKIVAAGETGVRRRHLPQKCQGLVKALGTHQAEGERVLQLLPALVVGEDLERLLAAFDRLLEFSLLMQDQREVRVAARIAWVILH